MKFFYATPMGVGSNDENLPRQAIAKIVKADKVLRFAYDESKNAFYVQDPSFDKGLAAGITSDWDVLNQALMFLDKNFSARFLDKAIGEPPGVITRRKASSYGKAWSIISRAMREDLGIEPIDVMVSEVTTGTPTENVSVDESEPDDKGKKLANLVIHKYAFSSEALGGDIDYAQINEALAGRYLSSIPEIAKSELSEDEFKSFEEKWEKHLNPGPGHLMFAMRQDGKTRVLRAKHENKGDAIDEAKIRTSEGLNGYAGPIIVFSFDPDKREIRVHNHPLQNLYSNPETKAMVSDLGRKISKTAKVPEDEIVYTFDPALSAPYATTINKYRIAWDHICNVVSKATGEKPEKVRVAEVPLRVKGGAALVVSASDEDRKAPGSAEYRAEKGMSVAYPFIILDNRAKTAGKSSRALVAGYAEYLREVIGTPYSLNWIEPTEAQARHLLRLGMDRGDVVDFMAPRHDLAKRAKCKKMVLTAWSSLHRRKTASSATPQKSAKIDTSINDWWSIGTQEQLNRAEHTENKPGSDKKPSAKPFNLKQKSEAAGSGTKTYEELLAAKHDKELGYQKTTEQLLKESRV